MSYWTTLEDNSVRQSRHIRETPSRTVRHRFGGKKRVFSFPEGKDTPLVSSLSSGCNMTGLRDGIRSRRMARRVCKERIRRRKERKTRIQEDPEGEKGKKIGERSSRLHQKPRC
jgi:hypothetical protein